MIVSSVMKTSIALLAIVFQFETAFAGSNILQLDDFLIKVQVQSPELQAEKSTSDEFEARAYGLRIPPPMVGFMNMRDSSGANRGIEVTQELPFPSKIFKDQEVRRNEAQAQSLALSYKRNEILLEAKKAYLNFWKSFETKKILDEKQAWLKGHVNLSRSIVRADSAGQIHLLSSESELDQLENELYEAQADLIEKRNVLKVFVPDLQLDNLAPDLSQKIESISVEKNSKSLLIQSKEGDLRAALSAKDLTKQAYLPDLVLRYRSYNGNEMTSRNEEVMVGATLPFIFFWQPQAEVAVASARQQRAEAELQRARLSVDTQLDSLLEKSKSLTRQLESFRDKLIPRAHRRMRLVENLTVRTMEGLDEHRMVMLDYLDLRQKEVNSRLDLEKVNIEILKIANH